MRNLVVSVLLAFGGSAFAQEAKPKVASPEASTETPTEAEEGPSEDWLAAIELPRRANALRQRGVPDSDVQETLDAAKQGELGADEAAVVLQEEQEAVETHGPVENFGAFVRAKMAEGLRGQELAAAIRAEHEARGKGPRGKYKAKRGKAKHGEHEGQGRYGKAKHGKHGKAKHGKAKHGKAKHGKAKRGRSGGPAGAGQGRRTQEGGQ